MATPAMFLDECVDHRVAAFAEHRSRVFAWTELQQDIIHGFRLAHWDEAAVRKVVGWRP